MTKEECMAMIKFYQDILYKIILGIGAANVTLIGFAFDKKIAFYIFIAFWLMLGCIIVFRYTKRTIAYFYFIIYSQDLNDNGIYRYLSMFLRCDTAEKIEKMKYVANKFSQEELSDRQFKKNISDLANPKIVPFYVGIYFTLFWTSIIILLTFLCSLSIWGWSLY